MSIDAITDFAATPTRELIVLLIAALVVILLMMMRQNQQTINRQSDLARMLGDMLGKQQGILSVSQERIQNAEDKQTATLEIIERLLTVIQRDIESHSRNTEQMFEALNRLERNAKDSAEFRALSSGWYNAVIAEIQMARAESERAHQKILALCERVPTELNALRLQLANTNEDIA